jgi:hypothetical protein
LRRETEADQPEEGDVDESARGCHVPAMPEAVGRGGEVTQLLTVKEAAAYLRISSKTLRVYERRGDVQSVRYPSIDGEGPRRKRLFIQASLDKFLAECIQGAVLDAGHNTGHNEDPQPSQVVQNEDIPTHGQQGRKNGNVHWMESRAAK